jgi:hypothetical protein
VSTKPCWDCDCNNVDDCLSKYKFSEARTFASSLNSGGLGENMSQVKALSKIINAECNYWLSQNEISRTQENSKELLTLNSDNVYDIKRKEIMELYFEINNGIVRNYCRRKQFEDAKIFAKQLPDKVEYESLYISYGMSEPGIEIVETCRKKYKAIKKGLSLYREIEPFKESHSDDYIIYGFPQKEALNIIEKYKKDEN